MRLAPASLLVLALVPSVVACVGEMPPPPELQVTSPERGLVQGSGGAVTVTGVARPSASGSPVARVEVNGVRAALDADGSFTAVLDLSDGATLLHTLATTSEGGAARDVRAVEVGELRPVGANIERAVTASLSAASLARLAEAAGPIVMGLDLQGLIAPMQPIANLGDSDANVRVSVTRLRLSGARFTLVPVDGGLQFSAELSGLDVGADAAYGGTWVFDGTTAIGATADKVTLAGTLQVTPAGTDGFTVAIAAPTVTTGNLRLQASGLVGTVLDLVQDNLQSTVRDIAARTTEKALQPLLNQAFGALAGQQRFDVMGKQLALAAAPAAVAFTSAGAQVTLDLAAQVGGSEASAGFIYTPNGTPSVELGRGVHVGLADDLVNQLIAQVHAIGLLDIHLEEDLGLFDTIDIKPSLPPMVSANSPDGALRLVLGDMIATLSKDGAPVVRVAINAEAELQARPGPGGDEIALAFDGGRVFVNLLDPDGDDDTAGVSDAARDGIAVQVGAMNEFMIKVPVPSVAGVTVDHLGVRADSGYVMMSGELH